jgi:hypothetical protein
MNETESFRQDGAVINWWDYLPVPKGSAAGGKLNAGTPFGTLRTVSAAAVGNKAKMDAIVKVLELTAFPNKEYYMLCHDDAIDKFEVIDVGIGAYTYVDIDAAYKRGSLAGFGEGQETGLLNYRALIYVYAPGGQPFQGNTPQPNAVTMRTIELVSKIDAAPRYSDEGYYLNLNNDNQVQAQTVYDEFVAQYLLGQTTDYDGFVRRWLAQGGQALLDEATQQLKSYGVIK